MNMRFLLAVCLGLVPALATAQMPVAQPALVFENPTIVRAPEGGTSVLKVLVTNTTSRTITLVSAETAMARRVMFQRYGQAVNGLVIQKEMSEIEFLPGKATVLAPGGLEVRLLGLTAPLETDYEMPLTFHFDDKTDRTIRVRITL